MKLDDATKARIETLIKECSVTTPFERQGNTYVMDAYIPIPKGSDFDAKVHRARSANLGFQRPETR